MFKPGAFPKASERSRHLGETICAKVHNGNNKSTLAADGKGSCLTNSVLIVVFALDLSHDEPRLHCELNLVTL